MREIPSEVLGAMRVSVTLFRKEPEILENAVFLYDQAPDILDRAKEWAEREETIVRSYYIASKEDFGDLELLSGPFDDLGEFHRCGPGAVALLSFPELKNIVAITQQPVAISETNGNRSISIIEFS